MQQFIEMCIYGNTVLYHKIKAEQLLDIIYLSIMKRAMGTGVKFLVVWPNKDPSDRVSHMTNFQLRALH